jgi:hypothetical protein
MDLACPEDPVGQEDLAALAPLAALAQSDPRCDNVSCSIGAWKPGWRLAMNSVHEWFSDNKVWIEFIIATVLLWLLMMTAIHELELRSVS